jgi:hypothetical protein
MTYDELIRRYPTNALEMPWYDLPDAELRADLRFTRQLRTHGTSARQVMAGARIADWIMQELRGRAADHARAVPARLAGLV